MQIKYIDTGDIINIAVGEVWARKVIEDKIIWIVDKKYEVIEVKNVMRGCVGSFMFVVKPCNTDD